MQIVNAHYFRHVDRPKDTEFHCNKALGRLLKHHLINGVCVSGQLCMAS